MSNRIAESLLSFDQAKGVGFLPFYDKPQYGEDYFENYAEMGRSAFGVALNSLRVGLVSRYLTRSEELLDIGIGDGAFLRARGSTYGYDINPIAVDMLVNSGLWCDVSLMKSIRSVSFWDSLEHIEHPENIVKKVSKYCFVSIPVFRDATHILESKHYKPNEHCWYFTRHGLIAWFWDLGFVCKEINNAETLLGREDIGTFVFSRISGA